MNIKKSLVLLTLGILAIVIFPVVALADKQGSAQMHSIDGSGITGIITFLDDGTDLFVNGTATGMDSNEIYVSLIYDNGSVPAGPDACEPSPGRRLPSMFVGTWVVDAAGNGELDVVKGTFVSLKDFRTISIRLCPGGDCTPPNPLQACGLVEVHKINKPKKIK